jgi:hypothetical protein
LYQKRIPQAQEMPAACIIGRQSKLRNTRFNTAWNPFQLPFPKNYPDFVVITPAQPAKGT